MANSALSYAHLSADHGQTFARKAQSRLGSRWLGCDPRWKTTAMAAAHSRGNASVMRRTASNAPADAPMAMTGNSEVILAVARCAPRPWWALASELRHSQLQA